MATLRLDRLSRAQEAALRAVRGAAPRRSAPVLVGGAVRGAWLARAPRFGQADLDLAVAAGALELARKVAGRLGGAFVPLDAERGTARVVASGVRIDVADWRAPTLEADLAARDYTVNALAVSVRELLRDGAAPVVDPTGGLADLRARRLRPPHARGARRRRHAGSGAEACRAAPRRGQARDAAGDRRARPLLRARRGRRRARARDRRAASPAGARHRRPRAARAPPPAPDAPGRRGTGDPPGALPLLP